MRFLVLLMLVCVGSAYAQNTAVQKYMRTAITLYENLEYEKALKQLRSARLKSAGPDDEAQIALLEGIVLADMGKEDKADTAFKTAFSVNLEAKLPVDVSPKVLAIAEKARANVRKLLTPQLEAQQQETERRRVEEKQMREENLRAEAEAAKAREAKRAEDLAVTPPPPPPSAVQNPPAPSGPSARSLSWIPGVVGLASGGTSAILLASAASRYRALNEGTVPVEEAESFRDLGKREALFGYVTAGVAAAGLTTAALMFALGGPQPPATVTAVPLEKGGLVSVQVKW